MDKEEQKKYPSIKRLDNIRDIDMLDFTKPFVIEEKYDGSNVTIEFLEDGTRKYYSRRNELKVTDGKITGSFHLLIDFVDEAIKKYNIKISEGVKTTLHGEYIHMAKIPYNKTHKQFMPFEIKVNGITTLFKHNEIKSLLGLSNNVRQREIDSQTILSKLDNKSPIEGIVMKQFREDGKLLRMKMVSKEFKESISKRKRNKPKENEFFKEARIQKFLTKLVEDDILEEKDLLNTDHLGTIFKNSKLLVDDLWEEEEKALMKIFYKKLKRECVNAIKIYIRKKKEETQDE